MIKVTSNKDGNNDSRGDRFRSATPNSYTVSSPEGVVGYIERHDNCPLNIINEAFSGKGNVWVFYHDTGSFCNQSFAKVKAFALSDNY